MKLSPRAYTTSGTNASPPVADGPRRLPAALARTAGVPRALDLTYLRIEAPLPASPAFHLARRPARGAPNALGRLEGGWGAKTLIVRAKMLDRMGLMRLLLALTPTQFAFIRSNVFVPPQVLAMHARLVGAGPPPASPVRFALQALVRGGRVDKLAYLFPYFHLLAGSHTAALGGTWCSVADERDARALERLSVALQQGAEPVVRRAAAMRRCLPVEQGCLAGR